MRILTTAVLCLFCVSSLGCGDSNSIDAAFDAASKENIQKCCAMYAIYTTLNNFQGPASKDEMIDFLKSDEMAQSRLERMNIDPTKIDSYMVGRDGEPLEFRWGLESNPMAAAYVVCWEQTGVEGVVQVGVTGGTIVETEDEDELAELRAGNYSAGGVYGEAQNTKKIVEEK